MSHGGGGGRGSVVTYPFSGRICTLEFFIVFKPKNNNKNPSGKVQQLYAHVAN